MTRPPDRVEVLAGVTNISAQIRDVARKANAAGIEGFLIADIETGLDTELAKTGQWKVFITITYQEKPDATEKEKR